MAAAGQSASTASGANIQNIDALISGYKWSSPTLTYAITTSASQYSQTLYSPTNSEIESYQPATGGLVTAVQAAMAQFSAVSGLLITQTSNTATATMLIGRTGQTSTAHAYLPETGLSQGGDIWFGLDSTFNSPVRGDYAWHTALHEIGHGLGLKHAHSYIGGIDELEDDVGIINLPVSANRDMLEYTVMSYRSYMNQDLVLHDSYTNGPYGYPQTLMMLDIAALQTMYGADFTTNSGNTTYSFSTTTGEMFLNGVGQGSPGGNTVFLTLWDGGGIDTYDFSNYTTNMSIDLMPGSFSRLSNAQRADLGFSNTAAGNVYNAMQYQGDIRSLIENAIGGSGNDSIIGNQAANTLIGGGGNDTLEGGDGNDTVAGGSGNDIVKGGAGADCVGFGGQRENYAFSKFAGELYVVDLSGGAPDGLDRLNQVERLSFSNAVVGAEAFTPVNLNGDLKSDIVWANTANGSAATFLMDGLTISGATAIGGANGSSINVKAVGDLNGDGSSDLIWQDNSGLVVAFLMNGTSIQSAAVIGNATAAFKVMGSGDLNGDGNSDIVLQDNNGQAVAWLMNGSTIINAGALGAANGAAWSIKAIGDMNGDGKDDLVWNDTGGSTVGYLMNGTSIASAALIVGPNGPNFSVKGVGDLNGDGKDDIIWQFNNGQAGAWLMNGTAIAGGNAIGGANGAQFEVRDVADLNGDGLMDLVWQDTTNGQAVGFLMNGVTITGAGLIGGANGADWLIV